MLTSKKENTRKITLKTTFKKYDGVDRIQLAQDTVCLRAL
jgi:hypothetical protein